MDKVRVDQTLCWFDVGTPGPTEAMDEDLRLLGIAYARIYPTGIEPGFGFHRIPPQFIVSWTDQARVVHYRWRESWLTANDPIDIPTQEVLCLSPDKGSARAQLVQYLLSL